MKRGPGAGPLLLHVDFCDWVFTPSRRRRPVCAQGLPGERSLPQQGARGCRVSGLVSLFFHGHTHPTFCWTARLAIDRKLQPTTMRFLLPGIAPPLHRHPIRGAREGGQPRSSAGHGDAFSRSHRSSPARVRAGTGYERMRMCPNSLWWAPARRQADVAASHPARAPITLRVSTSPPCLPERS